MNLCIFLLILIYVNVAYGATSSCHQHKTCGDCIQNKVEICNWCSEEKDISSVRCQPKSYVDKNADWCKDKLFPKKDDKDPFKVADPISSNVQIYPQQVEFVVTPGVERTFNLIYRPKTDFPLDVYFLLDYSGTMDKHRKMLKDQSIEIYTSLSKLTNNVILGVGGFVEKPGWPYTDVQITGKTTYAFKNYLNLTDDKDAFKNAIDGFKVGTNYDDAEAGLDALMQAMVCKVGWRNVTRRIIVLATDNTYHSAGDGKMLGAVQRNDMKCHWENNEYKREDSLKYDYPSVSQISKVARENNFLIIFAALKSMKGIYTDLSNQIIGSSYAELNDKDSTIMDIIKEAYKKSLSKGIITHQPSNKFDIKIDQECSVSPEKNCFITVDKPNLTIPVTITGRTCNTKPETITISPAGLDEKLRLSVRVNCHCDCEKAKNKESTRKSCNNHGIIECGACKCDKNWGGDTCDIRCDDKTSELLKTLCHPEKNLTKPECSGHGSCECGKCKCTNLFTGNVCEFDPNSCNTGSNGKICSGDERGVCEYGECHCKGVWGGDACDCPPEKESKKLCTGPFSTEVCSGRGSCTCGKCSCAKVKNSDDRYTGLYCDFCKDCRNEACQKFEGYAKCNHNKTKNICDKEFKISTEETLDVVVAKKIDLINSDKWKIGTLCRSNYDDGSSLLFKYHFSDGNTLIMIQEEIEKPLKADLMIPIASAIAGILLIGLLTVVFWKVLIEWYDKREYNKFCDEAKSQGFDVSQNPLYEPPTQNFVNPGFNQNI